MSSGPVSGGASQFTELRAGHRDANGNFGNPTIPINDGANNVGGSTWHMGTIVMAAPGTVINGGMFTVSEALGNKIIHPYSDFLLHDIETGDGIVQAGPQDTANKLRTAPLWGLRMRPRFMHDLRSLSLQNAIERHAGEAEHVRQRFQELSPVEKQQLLSFLNSL